MEKILDKENLKVAAACIITQLAEEAHDNAVNHGFYDDYFSLRAVTEGQHFATLRRDMILAQLAKIMGEGGEAVSAIQNERDVSAFEEELADIVIRTLDLSAFVGGDIGRAILTKMAINLKRPYKHGKIC